VGVFWSPLSLRERVRVRGSGSTPEPRDLLVRG
jgi:hypothetical protein